MSKKTIEQLSDSQIKQWIKSKPPLESKLCDGNYLYLRMCQNNTPYFTFRVRLKRNTGIKNSWQSIGAYPATTLAMARDKARGMRTLVARGINPIDYSSDVAKLGKTFGEITELFTAQYFPTIKIRSIEKWHSTMRRTYILNNVIMEKITEADIKDIMQKADKDGTKSIAAGILQRMKMIFKWAKNDGYIPHNPTLEMERSYKIGVRERYLQPNELKHFLNSMCNDKTIVALPKAVIYSLLVLLPRKEELLRLKWQDVDLDSGRIVLRETKNITNFTIIVPSQIINLWGKLRELYPDSQYVFAGQRTHYRSTSLRKELMHMIDKYNMEWFTPHDFRRTGMTILAEMGNRHEVIDIALGHVLTGVKKHYLKSHLLEERRKLLQDWADYLDTLLNTEAKPVGNNWLWINLANL